MPIIKRKDRGRYDSEIDFLISKINTLPNDKTKIAHTNYIFLRLLKATNNDLKSWWDTLKALTILKDIDVLLSAFLGKQEDLIVVRRWLDQDGISE